MKIEEIIWIFIMSIMTVIVFAFGGFAAYSSVVFQELSEKIIVGIVGLVFAIVGIALTYLLINGIKEIKE